MKKLLITFLLLISTTCLAESRIKVAVVDTGIYRFMQKMDFMCKDSPKSFIDNDPYDNHGHGSNIVGIIGESLNAKTHCIVSLKFYDTGRQNGQAHLNASIKAMRYILSDIKIRYVNFSMGGSEPSILEKNYIKRMLTRGMTITAAAGNESSNLDTKNGKYYPASYRDEFKNSNFYVIASSLSSSNYGSIVTDTLSGRNIKPDIVGVKAMSGTSQAAAQKMAKILKNVVLIDRRKDDRTKSTSNRRVRACR